MVWALSLVNSLDNRENRYFEGTVSQNPYFDGDLTRSTQRIQDYPTRLYASSLKHAKSYRGPHCRGTELDNVPVVQGLAVQTETNVHGI